MEVGIENPGLIGQAMFVTEKLQPPRSARNGQCGGADGGDALHHDHPSHCGYPENVANADHGAVAEVRRACDKFLGEGAYRNAGGADDDCLMVDNEEGIDEMEEEEELV